MRYLVILVTLVFLAGAACNAGRSGAPSTSGLPTPLGYVLHPEWITSDFSVDYQFSIYSEPATFSPEMVGQTVLICLARTMDLDAVSNAPDSEVVVSLDLDPVFQGPYCGGVTLEVLADLSLSGGTMGYEEDSWVQGYQYVFIAKYVRELNATRKIVLVSANKDEPTAVYTPLRRGGGLGSYSAFYRGFGGGGY